MKNSPNTLKEWSTHLAEYWKTPISPENTHTPTNLKEIVKNNGFPVCSNNKIPAPMKNTSENNNNTSTQPTSIPISSFQHSENKKNNPNNTPIDNSINTVTLSHNKLYSHTKIYDQSNLWITSDITQTVELHTTAWKLGMFIGSNYGSKNPINPNRFSLPLKYTDPNLLYTFY